MIPRPHHLLTMTHQLPKYASIPRYAYYVPPPIQYSYQSQIPQVILEPPKPPEPEPEDLPTVPPGTGNDADVTGDTAKTPVPATVEDAPDAESGLFLCLCYMRDY